MATNTKEFRVKNGLEISSGPIKINGSSGSSGQVLSSTGSGVQWVAPTTGSGTGDVVGPASSTINAVVRFDGTTGKLIKNSSGVTIDDSSNITTSGSLTVSGNATFDTNTLFVDATNDRVGVGTVSPSYKLDVRGMARIQSSSGYNVLFETWNTNERVNFMNDAGSANISAVFRATDYAWQNGGGSDILKLDSSGNLGVGTSSPDGKLEVSGKLKVRGTTSANDLVQVWGVSGGSGSYSTLELIKTADTSGNFIFRGFTAGGTGTAPKIAFGNWSATPFDGAQMTLDTSSGNLGLGTSSPSTKLEVVGGYSTFAGLRIGGTDTNVNQIWQSNSGTTLGITANGGAIVFGQTSSEQMRLTAGGSLGIGTQSPTGLLQLSTSSWRKAVLDTTGVTAKAYQGSDSNGLNFTSNIYWSGSAWTQDDATRACFAYIQHLGNNRMEFRVSPAGAFSSWTTAMVIDTSGNVGISNVSPAYKLDVNGTLNASGAITQNGSQVLTASNYNSYALPLSGGTISGALTVTGRVSLTNSVAQIYQDGSRLKVRSESVDDVAHFASYGMYLPKVSQTYNLYLAEGLQIGYSTADPYLSYRNGALIFRADATERARLTSGGNFGIANASPQSLLHIGADGNATITTSYDLQFNHYYSTWGANATRPYLRKAWNATVNDYLYLGATGNASNTAMGAIFLSNAVPFSCGYGSNTADGLSNEFLRITNTGNVGISTTAPAYKLDVNGTFNASGAITQSGNQVLHAGNYNTYAPTKTGTGASGTWNISVTGNAANITAYTINQNLGTGNQVTFDSVITGNNGNGTNFRIGDDAWIGDINIANTVRLQGVQNAANAYIVFGNGDNTALGRASTGSLTYGGNVVLHAGNYSSYAVPTGDVSVSNVADKIVKRDGNGHINVQYVFSNYLNQSGGNSENPTIGQIWTQNTTDNYCRKSTPGHFKAQMGMYHNDGTSTANRIIISTGTPTGTITNGDVWLQY